MAVTFMFFLSTTYFSNTSFNCFIVCPAIKLYYFNLSRNLSVFYGYQTCLGLWFGGDM